MNPVDQTKLLERDGEGDCCRAAIASLLEIPLDKVPKFEKMGKEQSVEVIAFLESMGYEYCGYYAFRDSIPKKDKKRIGPGINGHFFAIGQSPRNDEVYHAIIVDSRGNLAHDPHPSRDGVRGRIDIMIFNKVKQCQSNGNETSKP